MQEKQLLSRLNLAEQRIVDLYHKVKSTNNGGGGSITVNENSPVSNLWITFPGGSSMSVFDANNNGGTFGIAFNLNYKAYRAKITMKALDWPGYGYLYNWFAVTDARLINNPGGGTGLTAPNEWRVPSDTDWDTLVTFAGGSSVAGGKLKSTLNSTAYPFYGWLNNGGGTDDYNFAGLPGGFRSPLGDFLNIGVSGVYWSSTSFDSSNAYAYVLFSSGVSTADFNKQLGFSVRLVREATAGELLLNDGDTSDTSSLDPYTGNDGKTYVTVKIGTQIWLAQNLRETKYNDNSDIFLVFFAGNTSNTFWQNYGNNQEGAVTRYYFGEQSVEYDPTTIKQFYNDVLENTLGTPEPLWIATEVGGLPVYYVICYRNWNKTHIKITPGYDVSDFPTINERSLLIERAFENELVIRFRPTKRDNTGAITIEDLNNYNDLLGGDTSYVYVEILEYTPTPTPYYYYGGDGAGIGISNL